jgi:hypothetical protein
MAWRRAIMQRFIATIQLPDPDAAWEYSQKCNGAQALFKFI